MIKCLPSYLVYTVPPEYINNGAVQNKFNELPFTERPYILYPNLEKEDTYVVIDSTEIHWILTALLHRFEKEGSIKILYEGPRAINRRYSMYGPRNKVIVFELQ